LTGLEVSKSSQIEFSNWLHERQTFLIRAARSICFDVQFADDVLQEALMDIYKHWNKVRTHENLDAYAIRVLVSKHTDMRRKWLRKRSEKEVELAYAENLIAFSDEEDAIAERLLVQSALKSLTTMQRAVLVLHYQYGLQLNEIAQSLEIPLGTVASHLARGRATVATNVEWLPQIVGSEKKAIKGNRILGIESKEEPRKLVQNE
jgi:RNA polymerase sigma factor (sigma-70 family)